ncbi:MAG: endosialidase [Vallitalea sp.]|jgi:hypothetical protein|nr:endosialidase [Vallitalea sp.]
MAGIQELIRVEDNNKLSFGNHIMDEKKKIMGFEVDGDIYKVKTYNEITKLEKNGRLLFESVPGTTVHNFSLNDKIIDFKVEGKEDAQITLELEVDQEYRIYINQIQVGKVKSNLAGKVSFSVEFTNGVQDVLIKKA